MNRAECTEVVLEAKRRQGLAFQELADNVGRHVVWTTAAIMGQATMDTAEAEALIAMLGLRTGSGRGASAGPDQRFAAWSCPSGPARLPTS